MIRKPNLELLEMAAFKVRRGRDKLEMLGKGMGEDSEIHEKPEMGNIGQLPAKVVEECLPWHVTFKDEGFVWQ